MGHLASKQEIVAILRRLDLDGDAKINLKEFGEAIKTQLASSNPIKLRRQALDDERSRSSAPKKDKRASSIAGSPRKMDTTPQ